MKKSNFNLSYEHLTSFDMGELVPIGVQEVVQGDVFKMHSSALARCTPLVAPVMHPTHITIHHWFVPHRLVWNDAGGANTGFEAFITGGPDGTSAPTHPTITLPNSGAGGVVSGSLANYLGVPYGYNADNTGYNVSALPFRAYALIWNHFYRDEDLQSKLVIDTTDGADTTTNTTLQRACWEKDYFTSSRTSPQKGAAVTLPLGTSADVVTDGTTPNFTGAGRTNANLEAVNNASLNHLFLAQSGTQGEVAFGANTGLQADLTDATAASISDLRLASSVQRFMENRSRFGSRFIEWLRFQGVRSSDGRLQLPEYLGGGKQTMQFSEVLGTGDEPGNFGGHGIAAARSNRFVRFFEEPGYVISLAYVLPKTIYVDGIPRHMSRASKLEYFQPELQYIGQQAVRNKEVYAPHTTPNGIFGYQDRYDELRRSESRVSGEFIGTYDAWHFARTFDSSPTLNGSFVSAVPSVEPFVDQGSDTILLMVYHNIRAKRLVARDPIPRLM